MSNSSPTIVLPGAGRGSPDLTLFAADPSDTAHLSGINYPGWRRYIESDFSADALIDELASQIASAAPQGPIRIVGISIGGHFGYATALRLQARGHKVEGFCAIDTFMISSSAPRAGWKGRAATLFLRLLRERRLGDLGTFARSRTMRALLRLCGDRLPGLLRHHVWLYRLASFVTNDPICDEELNMRLLLPKVAPWIANLDVEPVALKTPAILIRTLETAGDDPAWHLRCPNIDIIQIPGTHQTIFESKEIRVLRDTFVSATRGWD
jgi:thioesterase domain-containing protein